MISGRALSISGRVVSISGRVVSISGRSVSISGRAVSVYSRSRFVAGQKNAKMALSAALKATATRDLAPKSMLCLRRTFPKKKIKSGWTL